MRILYVTTIGLTMGFFKSLIRELMDEGHTVDIACNETDVRVPECYREWGCNVYQLSCSRSPFSSDNLKAIKELQDIVEVNDYDIVHCHTPVAAICTRLACRKFRKKGLKVFYTAHGFHFYKGAPKINWMVYYPIEKFCSYFTDTLIAINKEDFELAKRKMKAKRVEYVPGVGIDVDKFKNTVVDRKAKRAELGIPENAVLFLSVGELNENKNHQVVIRALAELNNPNIHYMVAGEGHLKTYLLNLAQKLGVGNQVHLLGYRNDVAELYLSADTFIFPSFREGLSVSLMEALSLGLPCVVSKIRGNTDLVTNKGGMLFNPHDVNGCKDAVEKILIADLSNLSQYNLDMVKKYNSNDINEMMKKVYDNEPG